jgi:CMP/dCMP kinase
VPSETRPRLKSPLQVAIDGPVASGKSTVAARLAQRLGCTFLDTGALYRAVALLALERGVSTDDEAAVVALIEREPPQISEGGPSGEAYSIRVAGKNVAQELFAPPVSRAVSSVAAMRGVRERLVPTQRGFADERDVVMAGRDIGTVILPHATVKFFLTATLDARVDRRLSELREQGDQIDRAQLRAEIERRDERDRARKTSPLVKAPDAVEVDTSKLSVDQVVELLERGVRAAAAKL